MRGKMRFQSGARAIQITSLAGFCGRFGHSPRKAQPASGRKPAQLYLKPSMRIKSREIGLATLRHNSSDASRCFAITIRVVRAGHCGMGLRLIEQARHCRDDARFVRSHE